MRARACGERVTGKQPLVEGGCIFINTCSARRISFKISLNLKENRRAEYQHTTIHPSLATTVRLKFRPCSLGIPRFGNHRCVLLLW